MSSVFRLHKNTGTININIDTRPPGRPKKAPAECLGEQVKTRLKSETENRIQFICQFSKGEETTASIMRKCADVGTLPEVWPYLDVLEENPGLLKWCVENQDLIELVSENAELFRRLAKR